MNKSKNQQIKVFKVIHFYKNNNNNKEYKKIQITHRTFQHLHN